MSDINISSEKMENYKDGVSGGSNKDEIKEKNLSWAGGLRERATKCLYIFFLFQSNFI